MQGPSDDGTDRRRTERPRSGSYSADRRFDPDELFDVIASAENKDQATEAMSLFILEGDHDNLRQAIAIYTRSARARGKSVENVLADLNSLTDRHRERYAHTGELLAPTQLKKLVLSTVFEGFGDGEPPIKS